MLAAGTAARECRRWGVLAMITTLAGMPLTELRRRYRDELFGSALPFWAKFGIDRQYGGVMHGLDYDGALVATNKVSWFQGRAIWVYSFLYNRFEQNPEYLEIARRTKDFLLEHAPQPDGWWAEEFSREGDVIRPFCGDIYGMYFAAEGLQEYAWAARDDEALQVALDLMRKLDRQIHSPDFMCMGADIPGQRTQGLWMVVLNTARQMVARWPDAKLEAALDEAIENVIDRHYNPEIGLNNEVLNRDFSRPEEHAAKCLLGHSVETLWMVAEEALRRGDERLWDVCTERIRRHLDVGWDHVFGGFSQWINVPRRLRMAGVYAGRHEPGLSRRRRVFLREAAMGAERDPGGDIEYPGADRRRVGGPLFRTGAAGHRRKVFDEEVRPARIYAFRRAPHDARPAQREAGQLPSAAATHAEYTYARPHD